MLNKKSSISIILAIVLILTSSFIFSGCNKKSDTNEVTPKAGTSVIPTNEVKVSINTDKGEIIVALRPDLMPITVENFVGLVEKKFYDGLTFHRVEDWVMQGGDPTATGSGGSDKKIKLETNPNLKNIRGAIAMARTPDPDSATSQYYILKKDAASLDGQYAVFGNVIKGIEVVDKISKGDKMKVVKIIK